MILVQELNPTRLLHSPEQLSDDFLSQPHSFIGLLHTNYPGHYQDIDDVVSVSEIFSGADVLMNEWRVI